MSSTYEDENLKVLLRKQEEIMSALKFLHREREELAIQIATFKTGKTSISSVPPELLAEVFLLCLPSTHDSIASVKESPLKFTFVCRRWRLIVNGDPRLWTSIHVPAIPMPRRLLAHLSQPMLFPEFEDFEATFEAFQNNVKSHCSYIKSWIGRSGCLPLSITFVPSGALECERDGNKRYLDVLFDSANSKRIRSLQIPSSSAPITEFLEDIQASSLPRLEQLLLILTSRSNILNQPKLRVLEMPFFSPNALRGGVAWHQLTSVRLRSPIYTREARRILPLCSSLVECWMTLANGGDDDLGQQDTPTCTLPHLKSFRLEDERVPSIRYFLCCLRCPSLMELEFYSRNCSSPAPTIAALTAFLSIHPIRRLTLEAATGATEMHKILVACSSLEYFALKPASRSFGGRAGTRAADGKHPIFAAFLPRQAGRKKSRLVVHCPRLRHLYVHSSSVYISPTDVKDFLSKRAGFDGFDGIQSMELRVEMPRRGGSDIEEVIDETRVVIRYQDLWMNIKDPPYSARRGIQTPPFDLLQAMSASM